MGADMYVTSYGDKDLTSSSSWRAVSGFTRTGFGPGWYCEGGLRSRHEIDAWRGYRSNTTYPPDANL